MRVVGGKTKAFALPVVLITSLVMMIVLLIALASVTSSNLVLQDQYVQKITKEASESGVAFAMNCLALNDGVPTWTDAKPLTAGTDCTGTALAGCTTASVKAGCVVLTETGQYRTTFTVPKPLANTDGSYSINATGVTNLFRKSTVTATTGSVARSSTKSNSAVNAYVTPPQLAGGGGFLAAGHIAFYVDQKGQLYGWGDNSQKQINSTATAFYTSPQLMPLPVVGADTIDSVRSVVTSGYGASIVCIIGKDDQGVIDKTVFCRGEPGEASESGLMSSYSGTGLWKQFKGSVTGFESISLNPQGADALCGVHVTDYYVYCAGDNRLSFGTGNYGLLGTSNQSSSPIAIDSALKFNTGTAAYSMVYAQDRLTCGIVTPLTTTSLRCEGMNANGMLGNGGTTQPTAPQTYPMPGGRIPKDVITSFHSYQTQVMHVLATDGTIWSSGLNANGEIGDNTVTQRNNPTQFGTSATSTLFTDYTAMLSVGSGATADGNASFCGIRSNGKVYCTGDNTYRQLGNGGACPGTSVRIPTEFVLPNGELAKTVVTNASNHMRNAVIVLTQSGRIYSAGDNSSGRFATGTTNACVSSPVKAVYANGSDVIAQSISTLDDGTLYFLSIDGQAYAVGNDNVGQLGNGGTTTASSYPVAVSIPRKTTTY